MFIDHGAFSSFLHLHCAEEDAVVPDDSASQSASPPTKEEGGKVSHGARDVPTMSVAVACEEEVTEGGEEVVVVGEVVERDPEPGHGPLPRRRGGVAAAGDA